MRREAGGESLLPVLSEVVESLSRETSLASELRFIKVRVSEELRGERKFESCSKMVRAGRHGELLLGRRKILHGSPFFYKL